MVVNYSGSTKFVILAFLLFAVQNLKVQLITINARFTGEQTDFLVKIGRFASEEVIV